MHDLWSVIIMREVAIRCNWRLAGPLGEHARILLPLIASAGIDFVLEADRVPVHRCSGATRACLHILMFDVLG